MTVLNSAKPGGPNTAKVEVDRKKLGNEGNFVFGHYSALVDVLETVQAMYVETSDRAERAVMQILIEEYLQPAAEKMLSDSLEIAKRRGAVRLLSQEPPIG